MRTINSVVVLVQGEIAARKIPAGGKRCGWGINRSTVDFLGGR